MPDDIREGDPDQPRKKKKAPPLPDDDDDGDEEPRGRSVRKSGSNDGGVGTVIPYRNGMALAAYYCGVFGIISCFLFGVGGFFGIVPVILGIVGFMRARSDPEARGTAHALVGIVLGILEVLVGCSTIGFIIFSVATAPK